MRVSVVIPAHNEDQYLHSCLTALTKQSVRPYEIIVVDNASSDLTAQIARSFEGVSIVNEHHLGLPYARNRGFDEAEGEVIARCDADCVPPADWIERIVKRFECGDADALTGPVVYPDLTSLSLYVAMLYLASLYLLQRGKHTLIGPNFAIRKSTWELIRDTVCSHDPNVHEDQDLALHIHQHIRTIGVDWELIMRTSGRRIRRHPGSFFGDYPVRMMYTLLSHGEPLRAPDWLVARLKRY